MKKEELPYWEEMRASRLWEFEVRSSWSMRKSPKVL